MKRNTGIALTLGLATVALAATMFEGSEEREFLVVADAGARTTEIANALEGIGGHVSREHAAIGVLQVRSSVAGFVARAAALPGVERVGPDVRGCRLDGASAGNCMVRVGPEVGPTVAGDGSSGDDPASFLQWGLDAINAPEAWDLGATGKGVRVAVLDTGINPDHQDLKANVNMALAASFIDGENVDVRPLPPPPRSFALAHGTHTAGIIGAARNGVGMIGVAPDVEIVPIKVLSQVDGYGTWGSVISGIMHAADVDADVINMSLGGGLNRRGGWDDNGSADPEDDIYLTAREVQAVIVALQRAVKYAYDSGAVVIASAGNDASDGDHDKDWVQMPASLPCVISVSATGPTGWGLDKTVDLDLLASYSNYGQSEIDVAAPGGDFRLYPGTPLWWHDMVFSSVPAGGYAWAAATSMAAPHVAGVAALIIGEHGGSMKPAQVESILRRTAADLGKSGRDDAYGHGRVDAEAAVR